MHSLFACDALQSNSGQAWWLDTRFLPTLRLYRKYTVHHNNTSQRTQLSNDNTFRTPKHVSRLHCRFLALGAEPFHRIEQRHNVSNETWFKHSNSMTLRDIQTVIESGDAVVLQCRLSDGLHVKPVIGWCHAASNSARRVLTEMGQPECSEKSAKPLALSQASQSDRPERHVATHSRLVRTTTESPQRKLTQKPRSDD